MATQTLQRKRNVGKIDRKIISYPSLTFTYVNDGDVNGLFYWLGTGKGINTWNNPTPDKVAITVINPNPAGGAASFLTDRNPGSTDSQNVFAESVNGVAIIYFDLGVKLKLNCNRYSIRHRSSFADSFMRTWKLQGSNDSLNWFDVDNRVNDTTINNTAQWYTLTCNNNNTELYRYLRLACTGTTNAPRVFLSEWEFYGTISEEL